MAIINKTGIGNGNTIQAEHVTRVIDALSGQSTDTVAATGSFQGTFDGTSATLTSATINGTLINGQSNTAGGSYSHAEGGATTSTGQYSHAEGQSTIALNLASHAEGYSTDANGNYSHAEGYQTLTTGQGAHAEGYQTVASNDYSHAEGNKTLASGRYSLSIGQLTTASADQSFAAGYATIASANGAHAQGQYTTASGIYSHAEGSITDAIGTYSHAEGTNTTTTGNYSHAEGDTTIASGSSSHAEGVTTLAIGYGAHSEGRFTTASANYSHAEGANTETYGLYSHAEGDNTVAKGDYSHAGGRGTITSGSAQNAVGYYNTHGDNTSFFIIGDGTSDGARSDVFKAKTNAIEITGSLSILKAGPALNLVGTDHTYIALYPDGVDAGRKGYIGYASAGDDNLTIYNETGSGGLNFNTPGGTRIYVSASGRVGIGTTVPEAKFQVQGSDPVSGYANVAAKIGPNSAIGSDLLIGSIDGQSPYIAAEGSYPLTLRTSGSIRQYVAGDGTIAIGSGSGTYAPQGILDIRGGKDGDKGRALLISSGSGVGPDTAYAGAIITTLTSSHSQHINIIKAGIHPHSLGYVSGTDKFMIAISTGSAADSTQWSAETGRGGFVQDLYRHGFNTNSPSHSVHIDKIFGISGNTGGSYTDIAHNSYWGGTNWSSSIGGPASLFRMYGGPTDDAGFNFYTSTGALSAAIGTGTEYASRLFISASGNVGMGTEVPLATLHVNRYDAVNATGARPTGSWTGIIENRRDSGGFHGLSVVTRHADSDSKIFEAASAWNGALETYTPILTVLGNYRVGIGTDTPTHQLTLFTDSAAKPGAGGLWTVSSDIRLKENIQEANYDTCYDIVKNLPLKRYTWKSEAYTTQQIADRTVLGWIAQDVSPLFPKAVNSSSFSGSGDFHLDDCLSLDAGQIYAAMYGTIKKLIVENESLKSELQTIKTHLGL